MNIAVLVSGGVDSSVALHMLKQQGHNVTAFYLKIWLEDELSYLGTCPWQEDLEYVQAVCTQLDVPLRVVPLQQQYWDRVVAYTIAQVKKGYTPNPDMLCNQQVKFGAFYDEYGHAFDAIATGHYAQKRVINGAAQLYQSPDAVKDQTYFLARLSQDQLAQALFPIGHLTKQELREYAHAVNLPTKDRKDSQGICFLGKISFSDFIKHHVGTQTGNLVEVETGATVGTHNGFWFYTIGQRQGIGLSGGPWYVVAKDVKTNTVYISKNYYADDKKRDSLEIADIQWLSGDKKQENLYAKLRHGPHKSPVTVTYLPDNRARLVLSTHDQGIAPGQFVVLYDGDQCVASGVIV